MVINKCNIENVAFFIYMEDFDFSFITNVKRHNSNVLLLKMHEIDQSTYTLQILKLGKLYGVKEMSPLHGLIKELKPISKEKVQGESKGKKKQF